MIVLYDTQVKSKRYIQLWTYSELRSVMTVARILGTWPKFAPSECEWIVPGTWPEADWSKP